MPDTDGCEAVSGDEATFLVWNAARIEISKDTDETSKEKASWWRERTYYAR
jgi:hypothetical protein